MSTQTLRDFIQLLDREGELARVKAKVSPVLEIAEVCDRVAKSPAPHPHNELDRNPGGKLGGKALLFENVEGSDIPVAIVSAASDGEERATELAAVGYLRKPFGLDGLLDLVAANC